MILALTGYRGCGKSSVARELERLLSWTVLDTDALALEDSGRDSIAQIFAEDGEDAFRDLEAAAVEAAASLAGRGGNFVIALGGGALTERPVNIDVLEDVGAAIVYLHADAVTLAERLAADANTHADRPSLTGADAVDEVALVLRRRDPLYRAAAHHVVDATGDLAAVTAAVLDAAGL